MLFWILMLLVFGRMLGFAIRFTWGLAKILLYIVLLPLMLIGMMLMGFVYLAIPILIVIGVVMLIRGATHTV